MSDRFFQALLVLSAFGLAWLGMMAAHEAGHVLHALVSGGVVTRIVLHPAEFSRTELGTNPHPLFVAWGGAIWGSVAPLGMWAAARAVAPRHAYLARFFAAFCFVANGAYLAGGALMGSRGGDDAGAILVHGGQTWHLLAFGTIAVGAGLYLLNGLGPSFGLGPARGRVDRKAAVAVAAALVGVVAVELILSP